MKKEKKYLDYDSIKRTVSVLDVLTKHYNWGRFLETIFEGRTYTGKCPICGAQQGNPFRVSIEEDGKNSWFCLANCNAGGKRHAKRAGLPDWIGNHVCRATGITRFLEAGSTLEEAANLANHADMRTTRIYDKRDRVVRRTSVERIVY